MFRDKRDCINFCCNYVGYSRRQRDTFIPLQHGETCPASDKNACGVLVYGKEVNCSSKKISATACIVFYACFSHIFVFVVRFYVNQQLSFSSSCHLNINVFCAIITCTYFVYVCAQCCVRVCLIVTHK